MKDRILTMRGGFSAVGRVQQGRGSRSLLTMSVAAAALTFGMGALGGPALAATPAGEVIKNQASATYRDSAGNQYQAQSNLAEITVQQVYAAALSQDRNRDGAAGQTVYSAHSLTNNGNGTDQYTIAVSQATGDSGDFVSLVAYLDANNNGEVDAGEVALTGAAAVLSIPAGETRAIVVAGRLPNTAAAGATYGSVLTVTPTSGDVVDSTPGGGTDTDPVNAATNHDMVTVTTAAVLDITKSAVHDPANRRITYEITVRNNGATAARDIVLFDALPAGTTLVSGSPAVAGLIDGAAGAGYGLYTGAIDERAGSNPTGVALDLDADGTANEYTEIALGLDLDNSGTIDNAGRTGVLLRDALLPAGTVQKLTFSVTYAATTAANAVFANTAHLSADTDGDGVSDTLVSTNTTRTNMTPHYAVALADTGDGSGGASDANNDGQDDDGAVNGVQVVGMAPVGSIVRFDLRVTNNGNATDSFNLSGTNTDFPPGTVFSFWNATGTTQFIDTDGDGLPNTPPVEAGMTLEFQVRAQLPTLVAPADMRPGGYHAAITAESAGDDSKTATVNLLLHSIVPAGLDLSNGIAGDNDALVNADVMSNQLTPDVTMVTTVGTPISFPITIENDGAAPDSFQLAAGGSWNGGRVGNLPPGWRAEFVDASGAVITTTPLIPAGGEINLTLRLVPPSDPVQALADLTDWSPYGNATMATIDGNGDGDGDYPIYVHVTSVNTGAEDVLLNAVDVAAHEDVKLLTDNQGQATPGGSVDFLHSLRNEGNEVETVRLSATDSLSGASFGHSIMVDTDGDGRPDTVWQSLPIGSTVYGVDENGVAVPLVVGGTAGNPQVTLDPGVILPVTVRVQVPSTAASGQQNVTTLVATYNDGTRTVRVTDVTTVTPGTLRLVKTASVDLNCADVASADLGPNLPFTPTASAGAPQDCAIWQVVATNAGIAPINTVEIFDTVPMFTRFVGGSLRLCDGDAGLGTTAACSFVSLSDVRGDGGEATGTAAGSDIAFRFNEWRPGFELVPGASVTVRFATRIE